MSELEIEVLREMEPPEWMRPMDVGGHDGSHHSATLARLATKGLVERRKRTSWGTRGSYVYRITKAGQAALRGTPTGGEPT